MPATSKDVANVEIEESELLNVESEEVTIEGDEEDESTPIPAAYSGYCSDPISYCS